MARGRMTLEQGLVKRVIIECYASLRSGLAA